MPQKNQTSEPSLIKQLTVGNRNKTLGEFLKTKEELINNATEEERKCLRMIAQLSNEILSNEVQEVIKKDFDEILNNPNHQTSKDLQGLLKVISSSMFMGDNAQKTIIDDINIPLAH